MLHINIDWKELEKNSPAPLFKVDCGPSVDELCAAYLTLDRIGFNSYSVGLEIDDDTKREMYSDERILRVCRFEIPCAASLESLKQYVSESMPNLKTMIEEDYVNGFSKQAELTYLFSWAFDSVATIKGYYEGSFHRKGDSYFIEGFNEWIHADTHDDDLDSIGLRIAQSAKQHYVKISDATGINILHELRNELRDELKGDIPQVKGG